MSQWETLGGSLDPTAQIHYAESDTGIPDVRAQIEALGDSLVW